MIPNQSGAPQPIPGRQVNPAWRSFWRRLLNFALTLAICLILVFVITQFVLQRNTVIGSSMTPTLEDRDEIFVEKVTRLFPSALKRGDIVTADTIRGSGSDEEIVIIKRIVGLPGEHVSIRQGLVYIDGRQLEEPYLDKGVMTREHSSEYAEVLLGPDQYYLLGDNRGNSRDSRDIGPVMRQEIEGKLVFRIYPVKRIGIPK